MAFKGAQFFYDVTLKAHLVKLWLMVILSAVSGKREIMELGSIEKKELREFFLSSTHGGEMSGMAAFIST